MRDAAGLTANNTEGAPAGSGPREGSGGRASVGAASHRETRAPEDAGQAASRRTTVRAGAG